MSECTHNHHEEQCTKGCSTNTYQSAKVSVPLIVSPRVNTGAPNTFCCGEPKIIPSTSSYKYIGNMNGCCKYTVTQQICIEVPIEIYANADVGPVYVECGEATATDTSRL